MYSATLENIQIHIYLNYIPSDIHHTDTSVIPLTHLLAATAHHVPVRISLLLPKLHWQEPKAIVKNNARDLLIISVTIIIITILIIIIKLK